jgi:16S rRNA G1207 methylase RsmC
VERMFWDPEDLAKRRFFAQARRHLRPGGRVYVGWADFADLEHDLPDVLAREGGLRKVREHRRPSPNGKCTFIVYEYTSDGAADPLTEWET